MQRKRKANTNTRKNKQLYKKGNALLGCGANNFCTVTNNELTEHSEFRG